MDDTSLAETTDAVLTARLISAALPYMLAYDQKVIVVKYGGHAMGDPELARAFARDITLLETAGARPVVVHGGGPQISDLMSRLGKEAEFVDGLRVTDAESVDIVRMALVGKVNRDIVAALNQHGSYAVGLSGEDAGLITVEMRDERLGFVGDVTSIDAAIVQKLCNEELIPVIATVGVDELGQAYNINADAVAGAIALALQAEKLVYLTDVAGIYGDYPDESSLVTGIDSAGLEDLLAAGKADGGMIPKLESCVEALRGGVRRAHILDGRVPHALLLEFFTREGIGTMVLP
jgi:acetylglutamate kinase